MMRHEGLSQVLHDQDYPRIDTRLWLVRHGQTDWNLAGRWQGQAPHAPGLNAAGHAQALVIREQLRWEKLAAVYSSDLLRARQTAALIAQTLGLRVILEPRLREIHLGAWEGMLSEEIEAKYPQELAERARNPFLARAPGGESPLDVAERVLAAIHEIAANCAGESVLIVAHGVTLAVIICHSQGFPMEDVYEHVPGNLQPYLVRWHR
jgi:broad specificity phosphatase PhoE